MSSRVTWSRPEAFGAWVRLGDATLVAVDDALAERLGVPHGFTLGAAPRPLELHVAVTAKCPAACTGCYLDATPDGAAPPLAELVERLRAARDLGASTVAFGGGEPLTRADLGALARAARDLGLVPVMTTSGIGLTPGRARELVDFAQVNVSHDGVDGGYARLRGFDGASHAERSIQWLAEAGVRVGVNLVLARGGLDRVEPTAARVAALGAGELQLLRFKPAGRAADRAYVDRRLTQAEIALLFPIVERLAGRRDLGVRIDCALVPLLGHAIVERFGEGAAARLGALGVFGCEAGKHLGAVEVGGGLGACSFLPAKEPGAWDDAPHLAAVRDHHAALPEPCASCPIRAVCRGGCQAVSRHLLGGFAPDPECPRVVARAP